jgi:D,D-heptose 1,7-bisphosphate phosphatase
LLSQAVILVGGIGSRLGDIAAFNPKPLLPVGGRPFIEHLIQEISRYGFKRVTLLAGHLGEKVRSAYDGKILSGLSIDVLVEPSAMGTGGALAHAAALGRLDSTFLLTNGDSWLDMDLGKAIYHWTSVSNRQQNITVQLVLHSVTDAGRYGAVSICVGRVTEFREKSAESAGQPALINAGIYIIDRRALESLPADRPSSLENHLLPKLAEQGAVSGIVSPQGSYFIDIGLPETYQAAAADFVRRRRRPALFLDRDGTLNFDQGYTHKSEELLWLPGAIEAVRHANDAGYYAFVVTNQAGVAYGRYDEQQVRSFHQAMQKQLLDKGAHIDAFEWCPHHPHGLIEEYRMHCRRRKPGPGMILDLISSWPVDIGRSLLIGNAMTDMEAAKAAGIMGVLYEGGSLRELVMNYI